MDLEEIKNKKFELEQSISLLINEFLRKTGIDDRSIDIVLHRKINNEKVEAKINVTIEF